MLRWAWELVGTTQRRVAAVAIGAGVITIAAGLVIMDRHDTDTQVLGTIEERTTTTATTTTTTATTTTTTTIDTSGAPSAETIVTPGPPVTDAPSPIDGEGAGPEAVDPRPCEEAHPADESSEPTPGCYGKASDNTVVVDVEEGQVTQLSSSSTAGDRWIAFGVGIEGEPRPHADGHELTVVVSVTNLLDRPVLFDEAIEVQVVVQHAGAVTQLLVVQVAAIDELAPGETREGSGTVVVSGDGRHEIHGELVFALA